MTVPPPHASERLSAGHARLLLGIAYFGLAALYAWQASGRVSPTIFSDEIEIAQISRSIAETGSPARRGEPYVMQTLYTYLLAPAWWIEDVKTAWEVIKLIGVVVMTAAIFPAYGLARYVVSRPWAVAAAAASVAAPPLAFAPYMMEEPLAYPVSTAGLWAIAAFVAAPSRRSLVLAVAVAAAATLVRSQLAVLFAVLSFGVVYHAWRSERFRTWRRAWTRADWAGFVLLLLGVAVAVSATAGHLSGSWYLATGFLKQRMIDNALWSLGAVGIGLALLPLVAGLAALASPGLRRDPRGAAFAVTGGAAVACFVGYAAIKGAVVSTVLGPLVVERNLIYLVPVLLAGTAAALTRRILHPVAVAGAAVLVLVCLTQQKLELDRYPYFEAPGLAVGPLANRNWAMDDAAVRRALYLVLALSLALLVAVSLLRARWTAIAAAAVLAVVSGWALTTEIYASRGLNHFAQQLYDATPKPLDWVDRATGGDAAIYLGQRERDANAIWLLEFWNRSVKRVWSIDGTTPPPTQTPDLVTADGELAPDPGVNWIVARDGVAVVGDRVGEPRGGMSLMRIGDELRLRYAHTGVEPDGWMGDRAAFSLHVPESPAARRGFARVVLSRQGACGANVPTSRVRVRVGSLAIVNEQAAMGDVWDEQTTTLRPCDRKTVLLRATIPYHVDVEVDPTFVPREVDPSSGDARSLGAQVGFDFLPIG